MTEILSEFHHRGKTVVLERVTGAEPQYRMTIAQRFPNEKSARTAYAEATTDTAPTVTAPKRRGRKNKEAAQ